MAQLVLGPLLRYVGETEATVWVETDTTCEVEVLGATARTWCVRGHHYALVHVENLEPGSVNPYEVRLDGVKRFPIRDGEFPPCSIRTMKSGRPVKVVFGSCRTGYPHHPPYALPKDLDPRGREIDALYAYALRMQEEDEADWPHQLIHLGDQVYADEVSPRTLEFMRTRRSLSEPPGRELADFEDYTRLYRDTWEDPVIRWLLASVPSSMIFDDHDVHDDWNTSAAWRAQITHEPWWRGRITAGLVSYWIYQHLGNLSPRELGEDGLYEKVRAQADAGDLLHEFAHKADRETAGSRWSFCRDFGGAKLVMIDSRAGRVLEPGARQMVDEDEWSWIEQEATGGVDHLLLGTSLPMLLAPALHETESWNEAVCDGAWGKTMARLGEKIRRGLDLEHWSAFRKSFDRLAELMRAVGAGERGEAPASIVVLSGDVHHAYLAEVSFPGNGVKSNVFQAVCSPMRNPLNARERRMFHVALSRPAAMITRAMARAAGVGEPPVKWEFLEPPKFDNQVAELLLDGREAHLKIEKTKRGEWQKPELEKVLDRRLA
jgi:hypothetical protein